MLDEIQKEMELYEQEIEQEMQKTRPIRKTAGAIMLVTILLCPFLAVALFRLIFSYALDWIGAILFALLGLGIGMIAGPYLAKRWIASHI